VKSDGRASMSRAGKTYWPATNVRIAASGSGRRSAFRFAPGVRNLKASTLSRNGKRSNWTCPIIPTTRIGTYAPKSVPWPGKPTTPNGRWSFRSYL